MAVKDIELARLRLDEENPRHDRTSGDESDVIAALMEQVGPKVVKLAEHIVAHGMSPVDNTLVVSNGDGSFTVVEGNRRVAAAKLLNDPSLAPSKNYQDQFERLKASMKKPITRVACAEVANRDEAFPWLVLRHDGESEGASLVKWNTEAKARFFGNLGTQAGVALTLIDTLKTALPANTQLHADLDAISKKRKLTTFGRLLKNRKVRELLGIDLSAPLVSNRLTPQELEEFWEKIAAALAGPLTVMSFHSSQEAQDYVKQLLPPSSSPPSPTSRTQPSPSVGSSTVAQPTAPPGTAPSAPASVPSSPASPDPLKAKLPPLFAGVQINKLGHRVQAVLRETYELDPERFPNASAVMVRVLIELAVDAVFDANGWPKTIPTPKGEKERALVDKIRDCLKALDPSGRDPKFQPLRAMLTVKDGMFSVSTMNAVVHNRYFNPVPSELRRLALNYTPFLSALDTLVP